MGNLIPIQYHRSRYPDDIKPRIAEVAGNFDSNRIKVNSEYSLHKEYSFMSRKFNNDIVSKYRTICSTNKRGIPMLWHSRKWAIEFADFIKDLTLGNIPPKIIEIHPPFSDYSSLEKFMDNYKAFKERISNHFPDALILIENRSGTRYSGGSFILSSIEQIVELSNEIDQQKSDLRITLDLPQLFTTHAISKSKHDLMEELFKGVENIRHNIQGIHLWGKRESENGRRVAHIGDLNSYFMNDMEFKNSF